jgi:hypothetical protein
MAVTGMHFADFFAFSGGEDAFSESVTFCFRPTFAVAQTSLSEVDGDEVPQSSFISLRLGQLRMVQKRPSIPEMCFPSMIRV